MAFRRMGNGCNICSIGLIIIITTVVIIIFVEYFCKARGAEGVGQAGNTVFINERDKRTNYKEQNKKLNRTRMVQLPATAAIEYVAACCRTRTRTRTKTRTKTKIGTITKTVLGAYARSPQVQYIYAPSRLSVPSIVAWRTNKTNRQTRPPSSAGSRPPLPKFSGYVEVDAHYIFHQSTIWVRPLCTELGPKNPSKMPILPCDKRIYVALAAT